MTTQKSKANVNTFDLSKYQIENAVQKIPIKIEETGDQFEVSVKQLSWSRRNQLLSKALQFTQSGGSNFDGDLPIPSILKCLILSSSVNISLSLKDHPNLNK